MLNITDEEVNAQRDAYRVYVTEQVEWLRATMKEIIATFKKMAPLQIRVISEDQVALEGFCHVHQVRNRIVVASTDPVLGNRDFDKSSEDALRVRLLYELGRIVF